MTREEAIEVLKDWDGYFIGHSSDDVNEALNMAIKVLEQEPFINKPCVSSGVCEHDKNKVLDKIRAEIMGCLKALDDIEKFNIYLPNEMTGRRLTYQQCLGFIDEYKAETEQEDGNEK